MWTITKKSWVKDWSNYYGTPARTYYRKSDIAKALQHYSNNNPVDISKIQPNQDWNDVSDVGYVVSRTVEPYRTIR